jgi:hypothetical protein
MIQKVDLAAKFSAISEHWRPRLVELGGIVAEAQGDAAAGLSARHRALELGREACRRSRIERPDWAEWVAARSDEA